MLPRECAVQQAGANLCGDDLDVVKVHSTVVGDESQTFFARLSNKHTVKGITVMGRQGFYGQSMRGGNAQWREPMEMKLFVIINRRHFELAASSLDRYFPRCDSANVHEVTAVNDGCPCCLGQLWIIANRPEKGMSVK